MVKNCVMVVCLMMMMMIGSAFWIPAEVHAIYIDPKSGKPCDCTKSTTTIPACSFCLSTGSVVGEGGGNTQGASTSVFVALKPDATAQSFLICRNQGGTISGGKAFLPIVRIVTGGVTSELVDKNGKFTFQTGHIVPAGVHPEFTPDECSNDPTGQCQAIQQFCPNGGLNGNEGKNWVPIDVTPIKTLAQEYIYYCDQDSLHVCTCDPRKDAADSPGPVSATSGPVDRCASALPSTKTSTNTWTFEWTDVSGPPPTRNPDGVVNHFDIMPAAKGVVYSCTLPNPEDYFFGATLPYDCTTTTEPDLFP